MDKKRVQRKLTTILAADVEGYSRLMRADEEATLNTLDEYREIIDGLIARHDGRIFSTGGDSVLAEFGSAVEAVRCAISIQEEIASRNTDLAADRNLKFRIGINVGDVMVRNDDLFGDGVNVAARLEGLAAAGGVCISGSVFEQVKHKLSLSFEDMGAQEVKNIVEPISAYRLVPGSVSVAAAAQTPTADSQPRRPSLAVLPFANLSGDPNEDYFADGITEDLITEFSRFQELIVIARNSVFSYKGRAVKVQEVGRELGVRYILEGSVRKAGQRVRISAQLVEAATGHHLWAERYDREIEDVFTVQDEVTRQISPPLRASSTPPNSDARASQASGPRTSRPTISCCAVASSISAQRSRTISPHGACMRRRSRSIRITRAPTPGSPGPIWTKHGPLDRKRRLNAPLRTHARACTSIRAHTRTISR